MIRRAGRPRSTTHHELSSTAIALFRERGFDRTTVDEVANAAGICRRTLFRYFPSKNDLPWGEFDLMLALMRKRFAEADPDLPLVDALRAAIVDFNTFPSHELPILRERMKLLLHVPSLAAHSMLRYADWRGIVAEFVAARCGCEPTALVPRTAAWSLLGACLGSYETWLEHEDEELPELIDNSILSTGSLLAGTLQDRPQTFAGALAGRPE